ncbi:MAG: putative holin [Billgrantia sp.]|uniref:Putative phage-related membrane protein n=1 Tax=Thioalkalivibrio sulfidiphilus (strain HL-EbGR7) TaxID=396588 RepID=B8GS28_THISH|nr:putative holin [Thioalkalivibrio sulfidiphilus]ACL72732.1 putative phage-related membrane protein [Thioalkalivibrio sulfidiphilus HL-EbGr7]
MTRETLLDKLRVGPWLIAALIMAAVVGWLYPHQLGVLLWSLTKLSFGAYLGYWIDRTIFPYARPGDFLQLHVKSVSLLMLRRAIIIAAVIIALGLGV